MFHDAVRHGGSVPHGKDRFPPQAEIDLHHQVTAVAGHPPPAGRLRLTTRRCERGGDDRVRGIADGGQLRAGGAAPRRWTEIRDAHAPAAVRARRPMPCARVLTADGTFAHTLERERPAIHVTVLAVLRAAVRAVRVDQWLEVSDTVAQLVRYALGRVAGTDELPAGSARPDLVGREDRRRLVRARGPVLPADQAPRSVSAAQVLRAVHLSVHAAHALMRRADRLTAARAARHFVHAHRLVSPALTVLEARRA